MRLCSFKHAYGTARENDRLLGAVIGTQGLKGALKQSVRAQHEFVDFQLSVCHWLSNDNDIRKLNYYASSDREDGTIRPL